MANPRYDPNYGEETRTVHTFTQPTPGDVHKSPILVAAMSGLALILLLSYFLMFECGY